MSGGLALRPLAGFRAIMCTGSVTSAARQLGLTQPAMSRLLAQLERDIGFALFYRDRGRLVPTADAVLFLEEVDSALVGLERVERVAGAIAEHRTGQLRVVAPPSFAEGVLPQIIARFLTRFPEVHLTIESRSVDTALEMIATRIVDCGFAKLPVARPDLDAVPVVVSQTICVMRKNHRLADCASLDPDALRGEPLILLGLGRTSRTLIDAAFAQAGLKPNVRVDTHTIGSACAFAAQGIGIAIVNELLARSYLSKQLATCRFHPTMSQEYGFITPRKVGPTRLAQMMLEETRSILGE